MLKIAFIIAISIFLLISKNSNAQNNRILNNDTINNVHKSLFSYINCFSNQINLINLRKGIKYHKNKIVYRTYDTSTAILNSVLNFQFKTVILNSKNKYSVIFLCKRKNQIKFRHESSLKKYKKLFCYLDLFPLVKKDEFIYLKVMCRSIGVGDDEIVGYMYFIFNEKLQIIHVYTEEVIQ